jgi:hypothetical protein
MNGRLLVLAVVLLALQTGPILAGIYLAVVLGRRRQA